MNTRSVAAMFTVLAVASLTKAEEKSGYDVARNASAAGTAAWKTQYAGRADVLIADGVLADRAAKQVTVLAYATGIAAGESLEFFLTPTNAGKDYESLSITFARPSDVIAALKFIGLTPGKPIDFETNRQWPRGPRVVMTYDIAGKAVRAEDCVVNSDTQSPLPRDGLVFTGSYTYTDDAGKTHLAADENESKAIAADYNDPAGVLDVPRRAPQGVVYGFQKPSAAVAGLKLGQPLTITLTPAAGDAAVAEHAILITASQNEGKLNYVLDEGATRLGVAADLPHLLTFLSGLVDGKSDWFTTVKLSADVRVEDARKLYAVLQAVEKDRGIKLDPPPAGYLFYRAFFPDPQWRNRQDRLGEPWELFLARTAGGTTARLERQVDADDATPTGPKKILQTYAIDSPESFAKQVNANASQWSKGIFVYPPADLKYGELMQWVGPALATYPQVFVFPVTNETTTQPSTQPTK